MKKFIVLILVLVIIPFLITSENSLKSEVEKIRLENIKNPETANWEYIKDRLFDGETTVFKRLEGPILFQFHKSTSKADSLLVKDIILEIRELLPNKEIHFFEDFMEMSFQKMINRKYNPQDSIKNYSYKDITDSFIHLYFDSSMLYRHPHYQFTHLGEGHSIQRYKFERKKNKIERRSFVTVSLDDSWDYKTKKKYLKADLLRELVFLQNETPIKGRSVFMSREVTGLDHFIKERDVFLLQKLYSDDFLTQFEEYLYDNYPWRYAYSFLHKKEMNLLATSLVSLLGLVIFLLMFSFFQNRKFKYSYLNYFYPIAMILFCFSNLKLVHIYFTIFWASMDWFQNIKTGLIFSIEYGGLISFVLWGLESIVVRNNMSFTFQLILKVLFTFIAFSVISMVLFSLELSHLDLRGNVDFMEGVFPHFFLWIGLSVGRGLLIYLNHFSASLVKHKDVELSQLKEAKSQAEVKLLQSQINPHFLYNSLNSIAGLAHEDADKTEKMALSLSNLFRYSINRKKEKQTTIKDELAMVQNYLEIEQIRFGDRLQFLIEVQKGLENEEIPRFILQPLIENTVKHGVSKIEGIGKIILKLEKNEKQIIITVSDNGPDFPEDVVSGYGLQSVFDLLRLTYGDMASIHWVNKPQKKIMIKINQK